MSVQALVVLNAARTHLNDDAGLLWTDAALIPKLQEAHRELQSKLKLAQCPVMKSEYSEVMSISATNFVSQPSDIIEPIDLFEKLNTDPASAYLPMTEQDPFDPTNVSGTAMRFWRWFQETVKFFPATSSRTVLMHYWRSLAIPAVNTDVIGVLQGELYLSHRVASTAAASIGNNDIRDYEDGQASSNMLAVIIANKGTLPPSYGSSFKA